MIDPTLPARPPSADPSTEAARAASRAKGAAAERARCQAITSSPAARGREVAARIVAFETDLSAEAAIRLLASLEPDAGPAATTDKGAAVSWDDIAASMSTKGSR